MKIYTRTGDDGTTSLFAGGRISKGHLRLHAYGTVDELASVLGLAIAAGASGEIGEAILRVQGDLFEVGADLATPLDGNPTLIVRLSPNKVQRLEQEIDAWEQGLEPLKNFIFPGGSLAGALLHQARTVCRRAERWIVMLREVEALNPELMAYLNRLSDWLFVAARKVNVESGQAERVWKRGE